MSDLTDLIPEFAEESSGQLEHIRADIMTIQGDIQDTRLINRVFRVLRSIKGGSSFLGLKKIGQLSHQLERIFNLVRNNELEFTPEISRGVIKSVDKLAEMLGNSTQSNNYDIDEHLRELRAFVEKRTVDTISAKIKEDIEGAAARIDKQALEAIRKQGKKVYWIQFELLDESLGGRNPLDFFYEIEKTGEILFRNVDMELVLKDDNFTGQGLPLSILYVTVLEKDMVSYILGIDEKSVKEVRPGTLIEEEIIEDARIKNGAWQGGMK
jgi:chemotaxis protein histidine kinase CheA